jgi:transposase InsO family protein
MSSPDAPERNPCVERLIRTIKEEEVDLAEYQDFGDALMQIRYFIDDVYQTKRIHSALDYLTPAEFEAAYWARRGSLALPTVIGQPTSCVEAPTVSSGWS